MKDYIKGTLASVVVTISTTFLNMGSIYLYTTGNELLGFLYSAAAGAFTYWLALNYFGVYKRK